MPRRDDDVFDIPSIVPDTEGRPTQQVAQEATVSNVPSEHRTTVKVALPLLFLALAGACAFFHYELTKLRVENQQWSARVANLESQLGVAHSENQATRQTLEQKVVALETSAKTREEAIKKLQQLTQDNHSKALAELKQQNDNLLAQDKTLQTTFEKRHKALDTQLQATASQIASLEKTQQQVAQTIKEQLQPVTEQLARLQTQINEARAQLTQANSQATEASLISAQAAESSEQLQAKINSLSTELRAQQESIKSLDSFRRSANNDINRLKQGAGAY